MLPSVPIYCCTKGSSLAACRDVLRAVPIGCRGTACSSWTSPGPQGTAASLTFSHSSLPATEVWQFFPSLDPLSQRHTQHFLWLSSGSSGSLLEQLELALIWCGTVAGAAHRGHSLLKLCHVSLLQVLISNGGKRSQILKYLSKNKQLKKCCFLVLCYQCHGLSLLYLFSQKYKWERVL